MKNYLRDLRTQRLTAKRAPKPKALPAAAKPEPLADLDWHLLVVVSGTPVGPRILRGLEAAGYARRTRTGWSVTQAGMQRLREIVGGMRP